jgi:DNA ligase-1
MGIKRVMKAPSESITNEQLAVLSYPIVGSAKLDGFRVIVDGEPKTSSLKPWPNLFVREELSDPMYHGLDGELIVGSPFMTSPTDDVFHRTSGPLRQIHGKPEFAFFVFDHWTGGSFTYKERWLDNLPEERGRIIILEQRLLYSPQEVMEYENEMIKLGYEGCMIRSLTGRYKENRCSFNEKNIYKRKPFVETEAVIINLIEGLENLNEPRMNESGYLRRSSHQENKIGKDTLGSFRLKSDLWPTSFHAGTGEGYTAEMKQDIWNCRDEYIGKIATIKYQKYGSRDAPRLPSVIKIRPTY